MEFLLVFFVVMGLFGSSIAVASSRVQRRAEKAGPEFIIGLEYSYPDRHGRYSQKATLVEIKRGKGVLHLGHTNHADFPRPLRSLHLAR